MDFNQAWLSGRVIQDPVIGKTSNGIDALSFKMITKENEQDASTGTWRERATVLEYVVYGALAKIASNEIKRDDRLSVQGKLTVSTWEKGGGVRHRVQVVVTRYNVEDIRRGKKVTA